MNQLKVGDVVRLKSEEDGVKMTVASVIDGEIQCIYFNQSEQKFVMTMAMPEETLMRSNMAHTDDNGFYK